MPRFISHSASLHRVIAVFGVALVMLLSATAVRPELHAWLHGAEDVEHAGAGHEPVGADGHECAVTLFAQGAGALLVFCLLVLAQLPVCSVACRAADWVVVVRPRYWLAPSHAPPRA